MNLFRPLLLGAAFALAFTWPAATQSPNTSLGSEIVARALLGQITVPQNADLMLLYRGTNGDTAYTQSAAFMFAMSAANAQTNFGGL